MSEAPIYDRYGEPVMQPQTPEEKRAAAKRLLDAMVDGLDIMIGVLVNPNRRLATDEVDELRTLSKLLNGLIARERGQ